MYVVRCNCSNITSFQFYFCENDDSILTKQLGKLLILFSFITTVNINEQYQSELFTIRSDCHNLITRDDFITTFILYGAIEKGRKERGGGIIGMHIIFKPYQY